MHTSWKYNMVQEGSYRALKLSESVGDSKRGQCSNSAFQAMIGPGTYVWASNNMIKQLCPLKGLCMWSSFDWSSLFPSQQRSQPRPFQRKCILHLGSENDLNQAICSTPINWMTSLSPTVHWMTSCGNGSIDGFWEAAVSLLLTATLPSSFLTG